MNPKQHLLEKCLDVMKLMRRDTLLLEVGTFFSREGNFFFFRHGFENSERIDSKPNTEECENFMKKFNLRISNKNFEICGTKIFEIFAQKKINLYLFSKNGKFD